MGLGVIPKDSVCAEKLRHFVKKNFAPGLQAESGRKSAGLRFLEKQEMPVPERVSQVPPNRRRVADKKSSDAGRESLNGKFAPEKKQSPKRHDSDEKKFHAPEGDAADEPKEKKVARAPDLFLFDD